MANEIQAIRGMNDVLPEQMPYWHVLENHLRQIAHCYGYQEIRTPILEKTELFKRSIGEVTDIVEKEMYTFHDRNQDSLTLRPEETAGCVRAMIEHGLLYNQTQRVWYLGPLFRHERPQKGRYRQFYQFGVEAFGFEGADIEAEVILMTASIWRRLGLENLELQLNCLGSNETRKQYRAALQEYLKQHEAMLDEDSKRRLDSNPLRVLDSKNPAMQEIIANAPILSDYLDETNKERFKQLIYFLEKSNLQVKVNPHLVRGLDYYTGMVFEWVTTELGAQGTVCAGGRYDGLVADLGGQSTPAVGFALGCERVIELLQQKINLTHKLDVYLITVGEVAENIGVLLAELIRRECPKISLLANCGGGSFKSQFKRADKSGAQFALVLGDDEIKNNTIAVKYLREEKSQIVISNDKIFSFLNENV